MPPQGYGQPSPQPHADAAPSYGHQQTYYPPPAFPPPAAGSAPPGWVARFDENYKTWYYVNEATRIPQWAHPAAVPTSSNHGKHSFLSLLTASDIVRRARAR
jgi:hypothetical protein